MVLRVREMSPESHLTVYTSSAYRLSILCLQNERIISITAKNKKNQRWKIMEELIKGNLMVTIADNLSDFGDKYD